MSCIACDKAQEFNSKSLTGHNNATYIRVGNGNVMIVGCKEHLEEYTGRELVYIKMPDDDEEEKT